MLNTKAASQKAPLQKLQEMQKMSKKPFEKKKVERFSSFSFCPIWNMFDHFSKLIFHRAKKMNAVVAASDLECVVSLAGAPQVFSQRNVTAKLLVKLDYKLC